MQKSNIYQHNLRLNLDDERHLKVHRYLMNINEDVYKSKNAYIIQAILEGAEKANSVTEDGEYVEKGLLTDEQIKELEERITKNLKKEVLNEVLKVLLNMIVSQPSNVLQQVGQIQSVKEEEPDDALVDAALSYFEE
ncbi:MAG: hypothetical protein IJE43_21185 [Alphaproteobacteria bacterium]|nr:hypothetical protein [Alphaproteobacteria bacterium]